MRNLTPLLILFAGLLIQSCMVGPDYEKPVTETPVEWVGESLYFNILGDEVELAWWRTFGDSLLVEYINEAVKNNYDIAIASARVREARALRGVTASEFYPQIDSSASYQRFRESENGVVALGTLSDLGFADVDGDLYQGGFDAIWEIDIFGGTRRAVEAAESRVGAAVENRREVLLSVIAEIARNYIELRGTQRRIDVTEKNIRIQSDTLTLVQNKFRAGLASQLDVARARTQLESTKSSLPGQRASVRASAYRIAVLLGKQPGDLLEELLDSKPIPDPPDMVPMGLPSDMLLRRPDLRRVEMELRASTADIGVATADLFPRFFITGAGGFESISFTDFFKGASGKWSLGPSVTWPIFRGGQIRSNIKATEAREQAEAARYRQTVLKALEEVESALVRYAESQLEKRDLEEASTSSFKAVQLAEVVYEKGLSDFLTVLDAERTLTEVEDRLVRSETEVLLNLISLYKALGGGWEIFDDAFAVNQKANNQDL